MVVTWDQNATEHTARDTVELDAFLDEAHAQAETEGYPRLVDIQAPSGGATLGITVGAAESTVIWNDDQGRESTSHDPDSAREPMIQVTCYSEPSWFPAFTLIPTTTARAAAREFLASGGRRPANIAWDTDLAQK